MRFVFHYALRARSDLDALDALTKQRILIKLDYFFRSENPLIFAQPLQGRFTGLYRFRIGDFRVIFRVTRVRVTREGIVTVLLVLRIGHRRDIYRLST